MRVYMDNWNKERSYGIYNVSTGKITLLNGAKLRDYAPNRDKTADKLRQKYNKYIVNNELTVDIPDLSLSSSAGFIVMNSVNGWLYWRDDKGRTLDYLRLTKQLKEILGSDESDEDESDDESVGDSGASGETSTKNDSASADTVKTDSSNDNSKTSSSTDTEVKDMTPEEMLAKGLSDLLQSNKRNTIDIGEDTLSKIRSLFDKSPISKPEHIWSDKCIKQPEQFSDGIFGYTLDECTSKLNLKKALLLMGVPGTGKTMILKHLLHTITKGDNSKYKIISFSQSTDYTDFIGGLVCTDGVWSYKDGILMEICQAADSDRAEGSKYYLGIDEMSRGNTEAIFGELMTGIEHRDMPITLKNGRTIVIPSNLYIIGTMNISDNSTKKLDIATLERFTHYTLEPQWGTDYALWICTKQNASNAALDALTSISNSMIEINKIIASERLMGKDKIIGTRSISGIALDNSSLAAAILNQLLPEVEDRASRCEDNKNKLATEIENIKKAVKWEQSESNGDKQ